MPGLNRRAQRWQQLKGDSDVVDTSPDSAAGAVRKMVLPVANRAFFLSLRAVVMIDRFLEC